MRKTIITNHIKHLEIVASITNVISKTGFTGLLQSVTKNTEKQDNGLQIMSLLVVRKPKCAQLTVFCTTLASR